MIRTTSIAALALALMSSAAFAQADRPNGPPAQLSGGPASSDQPSNDRAYDDRAGYDDRDYDDRDYDDRDAPPPAQAQNEAAPNSQARDPDRDIYCRRSAAASTGYVTPGEAADHERAAGSIGGAIGGAALGAIIGGASHAAGPGALIGAGAGLIAGTAIGSDNARHAAADVQAAYSDAYYSCMAGNDWPQPSRYAYGPPPPPVYYPPYPRPYPYYYGTPYYGPSVRLNFGFGGGWGHGGGRHGRGHR